MDWTIQVSIPVRYNILFSSPKCHEGLLGPTQSPIQCVPGLLPWGLSGEGVKLTTTHLQLVLRLRMTGAIPLPFTYSLTKSSYLCSEECLAILIYIYSKPFNAHLP